MQGNLFSSFTIIMAMILLQGMMGLPFLIFGLFFGSLIFSAIAIFLFNVLQPMIYPKRPRWIPLYWPFIIACLVVALVIIRLMTYEGPWIN